MSEGVKSRRQEPNPATKRTGSAPAHIRLTSGSPPAQLRLTSGSPPAHLRLTSRSEFSWCRWCSGIISVALVLWKWQSHSHGAGTRRKGTCGRAYGQKQQCADGWLPATTGATLEEICTAPEAAPLYFCQPVMHTYLT